MSAAAVASIMMCSAGIGILGWWAWAFRPFNHHMWMVPLGLAMVGTPVVVLFSIAAASATFAVKF
ncbi:hypothetical protein HPP92_021916 [Vanilla planifolia]|uniref:Uncharacterized protein n=1 Tax=Vanilla planifolia TaxID=51239 RepID=A0A835PTT2_VANPL|nr:hypothetical protein HPP92_021916 [Vanilla planifolia]